MQLVKNIKDAKIISHTEDHILPNVVEDVKSVPARKDKLKPDKDKDFKPDTYDESRQVKDVEETKLKFTNDIEELKSKMTALDSKLIEVSFFTMSYKNLGVLGNFGAAYILILGSICK